MEVGLQKAGVTGWPLSVIVPGLIPNGPPLIWIRVVTVPEFGDKVVMCGETVIGMVLLIPV